MVSKTIVRVIDLRKSYGEKDVKTIVFDGADLFIREGEFVGIFAPSGYGKSTLIYLLAGLDKPDGGEIWVKDTRVDLLSEREATIFRRRHVGIVFQFFNLFPTLTALENVMLPLELIGFGREEARKRALNILKLVGLGDKIDKFPSQLSGGEQQRVAIARALAPEPEIVLADEPTGNLDEENAVRIYELLRDLKKSYGATIIMATHDVEHAKKFVDRAFTIRDKKIFEV